MPLDPYRIVEKPLITEKAMAGSTHDNTYVFKVALGANKIEIRQAIERIFPKVRVIRVNTQVRPGKAKRARWNKVGETPIWKRAVVKLHPDDRIDLV